MEENPTSITPSRKIQEGFKIRINTLNHIFKKGLPVLISPLLLSTQTLNKEFFAQQTRALLHEVSITYYVKKEKVIDAQKGLTQVFYDSNDKYSRTQTIEFSKDFCSLTVNISNSSFKVDLKDKVDIIFIKNKSKALAPKTYPIYLKSKTGDKTFIIYAKNKNKKALKSLSFLTYLCQNQQSDL